MIERESTDFQYPDDAELTKDDVMAMLSSALSEVFRWQSNFEAKRPSGQPDPHAIGLRTVAALWVVNPGVFGGMSLSQLSRTFGCSDSILSRYAIQFQERFGFKGRGQRSAETRENMRLARAAIPLPTPPADITAN